MCVGGEFGDDSRDTQWICDRGSMAHPKLPGVSLHGQFEFAPSGGRPKIDSSGLTAKNPPKPKIAFDDGAPAAPRARARLGIAKW